MRQICCRLPSLVQLTSTVDGHNLQQSPSLAGFKGRLVGSGGQGGLYRCSPANGQQQLVVKILELLDDEDDEAERAYAKSWCCLCWIT